MPSEVQQLSDSLRQTIEARGRLERELAEATAAMEAARDVYAGRAAEDRVRQLKQQIAAAERSKAGLKLRLESLGAAAPPRDQAAVIARRARDLANKLEALDAERHGLEVRAAQLEQERAVIGSLTAVLEDVVGKTAAAAEIANARRAITPPFSGVT